MAAIVACHSTAASSVAADPAERERRTVARACKEVRPVTAEATREGEFSDTFLGKIIVFMRMDSRAAVGFRVKFRNGGTARSRGSLPRKEIQRKQLPSDAGEAWLRRLLKCIAWRISGVRASATKSSFSRGAGLLRG